MAPVSQFENSLNEDIAFVVGSDTDVNIGWSDVYVPSEDAYLIGITIACKGTTGIQADLCIYDSVGPVRAFIVRGAPIPVGSSLNVIEDNKIVVKSGQKVQVRCMTPGQEIDVIVSSVENVNN